MLPRETPATAGATSPVIFEEKKFNIIYCINFNFLLPELISETVKKLELIVYDSKKR